MLLFVCVLIVIAAAAAALTVLASGRWSPRGQSAPVVEATSVSPVGPPASSVIAVRCSVMQLLGEIHEAVESKRSLHTIRGQQRWDQLRAVLVATGCDDTLVRDLDDHLELVARLETVPDGVAMLDADAAFVDAIGVLGERVARRSPVLVGRVAAGMPDDPAALSVA